MKEKMMYVEPDDYFPEETRKEFGLGEYNKEAQEEAKRFFEAKRAAEKSFRDYVNDK